MLLIPISGGLLALFAILALLWYFIAGSICVLGFLNGIFILIKRRLTPYYRKVQDYFFPTAKRNQKK